VTPIQFGAYMLLERLGAGTQGDVFLARRADRDGPVVVIKRIAVVGIQDDMLERRFRHEAAMATAIESPHVVRVLDCGRVGDRLYTVMEYVAGTPLSNVVKELKRIGEYASLESVVDVVCDVLAGLHALHTATDMEGTPLGFVHRDIAPKNLVLGEDGRTKVLDLGLGRSGMRDWRTAQGIILGSPGYMAPEQAVADPVDARADLFSVGALLFELLTLRRYITGDKLIDLVLGATQDRYVAPSSLRANIPPELDAIVEKAVRLERDERFPSAADFRAALRGVFPAREANHAKSLVAQMAWRDVLDSRARADALAHGASIAEYSEQEAGRQAIYASRTGEPPVQTPTPTRRSSVRLPWATIAVGLVTFVLGWFGRGFLWSMTPPPERPVAATPTPAASPSATPRATPTPNVTNTAREPDRAAPRKIARKTTRRAPPPEVEAPIPAPPPKAARSSSPPSAAQLLARAKAAADAAKGRPQHDDAKRLVIRAQGLALANGGDAAERTEIAKQLESLERALATR
jgi:serine/threonine protein kinase